MTFGERLKELRKERGLSQMELCEAIAVSRQTLSKWENDVVLPDVENLVMLAKYYGVSTDFLLGLSQCPVQEQIGDLGNRWASVKSFFSQPSRVYVALIALWVVLLILLVLIFYEEEAASTYFPIVS